MTKLPIEQVIPELKDALATNANALLLAPPGAGKTTAVPLALLHEPWLGEKKIIMLEPRRLAAKTAARYMARKLGQNPGSTVGYRVRLDTKVGPKTRIEVITEAILTRMLQADPALADVGLVIFDEFHERNLHTDVGLALCLQAQELLRDDLRLLVMSATLDTQPVAKLLGEAPVVVSEGRSYPVETIYLDKPVEGRIEPVMAQAIGRAIQETAGDILAFLPGAGEIKRVQERLDAMYLDRHIQVVPLYGSLTPEAQDKAIAPSIPGQRKIVLATSIAETSLTVEGVKVVVDCGLMRIPRFSPRTGMTRLDTIAVSRASADQRRGRAGRLAPGICYRLWTEGEDSRLAAGSTPEIQEADLAPLALELAAWGVKNPSELSWLDAPPTAAYNQALELLRYLGAIDAGGAITDHGKKLAEAGIHPRLAHMILTAIPLGYGRTACELATILGERDTLRSTFADNIDIRLRLDAIRRGGTWRTHEEIKQLCSVFEISLGGDDGDADFAGVLLAFAYPDRIAQKRDSGRFLMTNGRGAVLAGQQPLAEQPYIVAAELAEYGADSKIFLAAPVTINQIRQYCCDQIEQEDIVVWNRETQSVQARRRERLSALVLKETPWSASDAALVTAALLDGIRQEGLSILPWTKGSRQLQERLAFLHRIDTSWPDISDDVLLDTIDGWLAPYVSGITGREGLDRLNLTEILKASLSWEQLRQLDELAPTHITVPSGQRIPIDYSDSEVPVLAVRLQEMFGLAETPRIAGRRIPLMLHLLSPAHRPVQVTRDLANFWRTTYFEVRKDLLGRYPKHYWPDDPMAAQATHRTKKSLEHR